MRNSTRYPLTMLLLLGLAAPAVVQAQIPDEAIPLQTSLSQLRVLRAEYAEAWNNKDAAALTALYTDDAVAVLPDGKVLSGSKALHAYFADQGSALPHMVITPNEPRVYGNMAFEEGMLTQHPAGGGEVHLRYMVVSRRNMSQWKLFRTITVPMPVETGK